MIWEKCLKRLESDLLVKEINMWLKPLQVIEKESSLTLIAPNDMIIDQIKKKYLSLINLALKEVSDKSILVSIGLPIPQN